jgi:Mg2+-importing ATPase
MLHHQPVQPATQTPSGEVGKATPAIPLKMEFEHLQSSEQGLTSAEAQKWLATHGPNDTTGTKRELGIVRFLRLFLNPLILVLLIASVISEFLGDPVDASIIFIIVLLSNILNFAQTSRSEKAVDKLRASVALTATALRDGTWKEIQSRDLVPGDMIRLTAGDLVPADARLVQSNALQVQQAVLTGESQPVEKTADDLVVPTETLAEAHNRVFAGTSVMSGSATALVTATGRHTAFGDIAASLATRPPQTEFERGMQGFSFLMVRTVAFLVLFIFLVGILGHHKPLETILFAVSLAVGLTPEGMPAITTITLAQGAQNMAKKKVIVKYLESIENFGSFDTFCSDKTGTLTTGETQLAGHLDLAKQASDRVLLFGYLNSAYDTGIKSPLDDAILQCKNVDVSGYSKMGEIPFDFDRRRLSVIAQHGDELLLITKGAPESVVPCCSMCELDGARKPLDDTARAQAVKMYQDLNTQGYRALAVAYRQVPREAHYGVTDEQTMVLLGFLTFADPPKSDTAPVLQTLKADGVRVKILTGDNELVTRHVCEQVGLDVGRLVLGGELDQISEEALPPVAEQANVFARVAPAQKNRIILALKKRKHVVGYMGDGINDAPSLHTADVGISVSTGVDVAKEAAAIILLEMSLEVLHNGIEEGRKCFGNVLKYLLMATSSNFGNMFSMAGAYVFLPFLPMLPSQILLNNLLYDASQVAIPTDNVDPSVIKKPQQWDFSLIRNFMIVIGPLSSIFDFLTFFIMLHVFNAGAVLFHTGWFVESLATQTLVVLVIRTPGSPLRSRPSLPLLATVLLVVAIGMVLPYTPLARPLGFTPLPGLYFLFLLAMIVTYLLLVDMVKRRLMSPYAQ